MTSSTAAAKTSSLGRRRLSGAPCSAVRDPSLGHARRRLRGAPTTCPLAHRPPQERETCHEYRDRQGCFRESSAGRMSRCPESKCAICGQTPKYPQIAGNRARPGRCAPAALLQWRKRRHRRAISGIRRGSLDAGLRRHRGRRLSRLASVRVPAGARRPGDLHRQPRHGVAREHRAHRPARVPVHQPGPDRVRRDRRSRSTSSTTSPARRARSTTRGCRCTR